jgi:hypothetical protein
MIYHIVVGDLAAAQLQEAVSSEPSMEGTVVVLKDILNVGPLQKEEGTSFSAMRSAFWQEVVPNEKNPAEVDDLERLLEVSTQLHNHEDAKAWIWMAPIPADVCSFYWVLHYLGKHKGKLFHVSIEGLPFLNETGKVFFPKSLAEIMPKELVKARRLARPVTPAEVETDSETWNKMVEENTGIRTTEGGKRISSKNETHYDNQLESFCSHQFQKASRVVSQTLSKYNVPTGDLYLGWRLRKMAEEGRILLQGDTAKTLKDFEVKLPGGEPATATTEENATNEQA